jgi:hypothetical protein
MPMGGRELKFSFALDETSFQRVKRALSELTAEAQKFAKAMQNTQGGLFGGAQAGRPAPPGAAGANRAAVGNNKGTGIGASILQDVNAFQQLASKGGTALGAMTEAVRRAVSAQQRELDQLDRKISLIIGRYNQLNDKQAARAQQSLLGLQSQRGSAQEQMDSLRQLAAPPPPPAPPGRTPSFMDRVRSPEGVWGGLLQGIAPPGWMGAMRVGGLALAGATGIANVAAATNTFDTNFLARRGQATNPALQRMFRSDVTDAVMRQMMDRDYRRDVASTVNGRAAMVQQGMGVAKGIGVGAVSLGNFGDPTGEGLASWDTAKYEREQAELEKFKTTGVGIQTKLGLDYLGQDRRSANRILGLGVNRDPKTGRYDVMKYAKFQQKMLNSNIDEEEYIAATVQARQMGGRQFASKYAGSMASASAAGYGGYGSALAAAAMGGAGAGIPASRLVGGALGAGKIDTQAGINLATSMFGFDPRGTTSGLGMMLAAQGGGFQFTGGAGDFNLVERLKLGAQLGSGITTGGLDSYQQGRNIIGAIGLNPTGSTYAQDYLGTGMSMKQMMDAASGGGMTATAKAMGLSPEMIKKQLSGSMSSVMDRFVDQGTSDPMSKAIRGYRQSGMGIDQYLQSLYKSGNREQADAIGAYFGMMSGEGEEAGLGLAGLLGGMDNKTLKEKKGPAAAFDDATKELRKAMADQVDIASKAAALIVEQYTKALGENASQTLKTMSFSTDSINIESMGNIIIMQKDKPTFREETVKAGPKTGGGDEPTTSSRGWFIGPKQ